MRRVRLLLVCWLCVAPLAVAEDPQVEAYERQMSNARDLLRRGRADDAIKAFKKANKLAGNASADAYSGLAQAFMKAGAYKDVVEACQRGLQFAGGDEQKAVLHSIMATGLERLGQQKKEKLQDAEREYREAMRLRPDLPLVHFQLGRLLMEMGQDAEGTAELKQFLGVHGNHPWAAAAGKLIENPRRAREPYIPDFSVTTADGSHISTDDLEGKVVVLDFWGTWCPPCRASVPDMKGLVKRFSKDPVVVLSISSDTDEARWRKFIEDNKMDWPQYFDRDQHVIRAFGVHVYPTYVVVDPEGIMRKVEHGGGGAPLSWVADEVKKNLKVLAQQKAKAAAAN